MSRGTDITVAALFVETNGVYFNLPGVDPWDEKRDARLYPGPHPVVAHPPCERWGRYWSGGPSARVRRQKGDDGGCFAAALEAVRRFGGVLEHPEASHAWEEFRLARPPHTGGWIPDAADPMGWTCCVEQGHYGHPARKKTWLYFLGPSAPPELTWGPSQGRRLDEGFHSKEERQRARAAGVKPRARLSRSENLATPLPFRDLLLSLARHSALPLDTRQLSVNNSPTPMPHATAARRSAKHPPAAPSPPPKDANGKLLTLPERPKMTKQHMFRTTLEEHSKLDADRIAAGFYSMSKYVRHKLGLVG